MKNLLIKIQKILNIKIQKNQGLLIICSSITGFIFCYISARIQKEIVSNLPAEFLSIQALWFCISALIIGVIWKGMARHFAIKYFTVLALSESIIAFVIGMYLVFINYNIWIFAIGSLLYSSMISIFVGKCIMCFESKLWQVREREDFDNTNSVVTNIINCLGFGTSVLFMPSIKTAIFLWGLSCIFDDIGWILVYRKNKSLILKGEK